MIKLFMGGSRDLLYYESRKSYLGIYHNGKIVFKGNANIAPHSSIYVSNSVLSFGKCFKSNNGCKFSCVEGIFIGNYCLLGGGVSIRDSDGHRVGCYNEIGKKIEHKNKDRIIIGNHVWIANKVDILKGVKIPDDCIIAYRSLLIDEFEQSSTLIGGIPARCIKNKMWWKI